MESVTRANGGAVARSAVHSQFALTDALDLQRALSGAQRKLPSREACARQGWTGIERPRPLPEESHPSLVGLALAATEDMLLSLGEHRDFPDAKRLFRRPCEHENAYLADPVTVSRGWVARDGEGRDTGHLVY
jgi:hypothetical protein